MDKIKAIEILQHQIEPIEGIKQMASHGQEFKKWTAPLSLDRSC